MATARDIVNQLLTQYGVERADEFSSADARALLEKLIQKNGPIKELSNTVRNVLLHLKIPFTEEVESDPGDTVKPELAEPGPLPPEEDLEEEWPPEQPEEPKPEVRKRGRPPKRIPAVPELVSKQTPKPWATAEKDIDMDQSPVARRYQRALSLIRAVVVLAGGNELSNRELTEMSFGQILHIVTNNGGVITAAMASHDE